MDDKSTMEKVIRDMAAEVVNAAVNRRDRPSYGYTKTAIRSSRERMEGAIGMYMVMTGQAAHPGVSSMALFDDGQTTERVAQARNEANSL